MSNRKAQIHTHEGPDKTFYTIRMENEKGHRMSRTASSLSEAKQIKENFENGSYQVLTED